MKPLVPVKAGMSGFQGDFEQFLKNHLTQYKKIYNLIRMIKRIITSMMICMPLGRTMTSCHQSGCRV